MKEIKKIDAENCCVKIVGYNFTKNRGYYGADVELNCQLIDEETEKLLDLENNLNKKIIGFFCYFIQT